MQSNRSEEGVSNQSVETTRCKDLHTEQFYLLKNAVMYFLFVEECSDAFSICWRMQWCIFQTFVMSKKTSSYKLRSKFHTAEFINKYLFSRETGWAETLLVFEQYIHRVESALRMSIKWLYNTGGTHKFDVSCLSMRLRESKVKLIPI